VQIRKRSRPALTHHLNRRRRLETVPGSREIAVECHADGQEHHDDEEVGRAAKVAPDSRTPRRLIIMTNSTSPTAMKTRYEYSTGNAETICATPDDTDTATVRM